ncbi:MAG: type-F conjugative transfer system protein TraW [Pseudomonadota bacterium]
MVKLGAVALTLVILLNYSAIARDLGVHGHLYAIDETDLLSHFAAKLNRLSEDGALARHQTEFIEQARQKILTPPAVKGIKRTSKPRTFTYDPSILVPYDLKDHQGRVFQKAGTRFNPLEMATLRHVLVFISGQDEQQLAWFARYYLQHKKPAKLILVDGSPQAIAKRFASSCFFDQAGILTKKLGISQVPAVVSQQQKHLLIQELEISQGKTTS